MIIKKIFYLFMLCTLGLFAPLARGGELDVRATELLERPAGIFDVESENGQIVRLKIKAEADVPTSMRASRADRYAREKASRDARAEFTRYLAERTVFSDFGAEGVMIQEKSGQETSEIIETSARLFSSNSTALLNGLVTLLDHIEGEGGSRVCTVVLGWSKKSSNAASQAKSIMQANANPSSPNSPENNSVVDKQKGNTSTRTRIGNIDDF